MEERWALRREKHGLSSGDEQHESGGRHEARTSERDPAYETRALGLSAYALEKALNVPGSRVTEILYGLGRGNAAAGAVFRDVAVGLAEPLEIEYFQVQIGGKMLPRGLQVLQILRSGAFRPS